MGPFRDSGATNLAGGSDITRGRALRVCSLTPLSSSLSPSCLGFRHDLSGSCCWASSTIKNPPEPYTKLTILFKLFVAMVFITAIAILTKTIGIILFGLTQDLQAS